MVSCDKFYIQITFKHTTLYRVKRVKICNGYEFIPYSEEQILENHTNC